MATSSIYKEVRVKGRRFCRHFVRALENAEGAKSKEVTYSKLVQEIKGDNIKKMFGDK